jgi:hypothetical protein
MKANTGNNSKITGMILCIFIICSSILFLTGCQKEELTQLNNTTENEGTSLAKIAQNTNYSVYTIVNIEHFGSRTITPEYSIELRSDGIATFEGKRFTAFTGIKKFKVSLDLVDDIQAIFINGKFSKIPTLPLTMDLATITTTFKSGPDANKIIKTDYNNLNDSKMLITLRENVESLLNISSLVTKKRNIDDLQVGQGTEKR